MLDREKVSEVLDQIRPSLQADGGDVELVDITDDGIVVVELQGACKGCPMSQITLANGVERILKDRIPEVKGVRSSDIPADFDAASFFGGQPA
ncbi:MULTISPECIES: NifU family protein [unclassified Adlercreutzia]|uniref:NifU family protein n=1 Tax=unclassified Adlercreutzia TaxID=2636013 RepID=UPI0013ECC4ED|nr:MULTISPECIES: NifU family protein [unclassified Adlercreutzia]